MKEETSVIFARTDRCGFRSAEKERLFGPSESRLGEKHFVCRRAGWLLLWAVLVFHSDAPGSEPYRWLRILPEVSYTLNRPATNPYWRSAARFGLTARTPLRLGRLGLALQYRSFEARSSQVPDFRTLWVGIHWALGLPALGPLRLQGWAGPGLMQMWFDRDHPAVNQGLLVEREVGLAAGLEAALPVQKRLRLVARLDYQTVYTRVRMRFWTLGAGLSWELPAPDWLRRVLQ
ncbi:MAG: hypothetical protein D6715_13255 [Calditrichaeota bacterium]|nr:MAG: hypothetical protein D6715_13255 [Calditrichota bacterium]